MPKQLADSYRLHPARKMSIPQHMRVLSCPHLVYQDRHYYCNLLAIDRLSVLTPEGLQMKFLSLLLKAIPLVALLHHLHSGEDRHHLSFLMNLVIYPLTLLLPPWKLIALRIMAVVIIRLENQLVDLLVKASYCNILRHHDRCLTTPEILHTPIIITTHSLVRTHDQFRQLPTVAVPGPLCSKLTQLVNLLDLHNPAQLPLNVLLVCMRHMSKIILPSKRVVGIDGLPHLITAIGASVVRGMVVTIIYLILLSHTLSTRHALHEHIALLNLLLDNTRLVTGITSLL
jgi:hypothetical protein